MTFDKMCRDLLFEICEKHDLYLRKDPSYGGRAYMEKQEYIIAQQKKKLAEMEAALEAATLKLFSQLQYNNTFDKKHRLDIFRRYTEIEPSAQPIP